MKKLIYIVVSMIVLMMSWENSIEASQLIPNEAIRIRIIANSDSPQDQWIKKKVRDAVIDEVNQWAGLLEVSNLPSARKLINSHLSGLDQVIVKTLMENGFSYTHQLELGKVPFPTKIFGNQVYPAGEYEALRVILGEGEGKNWWCVLFPPLCLVDLTTSKDKNPQKPVDNQTASKSKHLSVKLEKTGKTELQKSQIKPASFFAELWESWF